MADKVLKDKRRLFVRSVDMGTINGLLDELFEKRVLNHEEMERVRCAHSTVMDQARVLIDSVLRKGPNACQIFISNICNEDIHLAQTLGLSSGSPSGNDHTKLDSQVEVPSLPAFVENMPGPTIPDSEESTDTLKLCPPETFVKMYKEKAEEIYPIKERKDRTRLALIICNIEFDHLSTRDGAELDIAGMESLLEGLGYSVVVKRKLTAKGMESVLREFAARPEHKSSDSTFLVLMSHGILNGICGTAHSVENPDVLAYDTIFQIFNNRHCLNLKDKPKVIIIQACRGENPGELWVSDSPKASTDSWTHQPLMLQSDAIHKVHVEKDFIAFCSSTPHNVSWRHITKGSLFIAQLITCFQKYSWCCHLEGVFRKVQQSFEKPDVKAQMPTIERVSMTRYFYLFPGH
ncbi:caspase-1 [Canis lupus familiaris]|uniref:Caspase-1 n=1 Tax=Canis lupus familiaris TaxID=9615 RepID=CASP1_CANLF|nr:caspase-1 [Canis lupus familiaris]Q9MZV7.1 RecName: Full=Caspase-1; Short=CASP-1; AltName: Full=Interleukin-1 beta convertase; Short=IL-1BC; AltName: Full=Interleukin-1 beta-converting enzyme; Short=ICE; Short=IL-1 beta-converting enzyme; AltName: Full=p45; Contains: RecName: Full=Caspase-1 subunit p20; Contains: RecName: Full=Caspase-1 subunit p10; Flags: Precursor [Canis lupus familiaris]AAF64388.1 caspase-1-like protein [Canis lupus familiaris]|eukprot:NP_001003125.1 caspase-1 [Canis lupus familiaris]